jgi:hypothetical protein
MGPIAVKTYPGEEWKLGPNRATFEPDYGRRGKLWVHGLFEPATGEAAILMSPSRDSASHIQLLESMITRFPADRWLLIEDNLSIHQSPGQIGAGSLARHSGYVYSQICLLAEPDRTLVEAAPFAGAQRAAF